MGEFTQRSRGKSLMSFQGDSETLKALKSETLKALK